jgi:hypothetical protein
MRFPVEIGKTYESDLEGHLYDENTIGKGLHSFYNISDCEEDSLREESDMIVECIIPKGASYHEGIFDIFPSYASNKLKYVKICV